MAFGFPMLFHFDQNGSHFVQIQWKSELNGHHLVWISNGLVLEWLGPYLLLLLTIPKLNNWKFELQNVCYSNVFGISMFHIQAYLYPHCMNLLQNPKIKNFLL